MDISGAPFHLNEEQQRWVEETLDAMTLEQKIGQMFCPIGLTYDQTELAELLQRIPIGGIMFRPGPKEEVQAAHRFLQEQSEIPLLLAANLESGGVGIASEGTLYGTQMQVAATGDTAAATTLGRIAGREGRALGLNWAFAPVVDIDWNFRNPITNTRTYGSDVDTVRQMGAAYVQALHEEGLAVSIKHFPGDGVDERDQHLLPSVNDLSPESWRASFGAIYAHLIDQGAQTVMIGHILAPKLQQVLRPDLRDEDVMPATLAPELLHDLLRTELGFQGMIVTDATPMAGFMQMMKRCDAVPLSIAAGCDMFLFNQNLQEDFEYMLDGLDRGLLTIDRVDEAVTRILALKASLGLPEQKQAGTLVPGPEALDVIGCEEHVEWARQCADQSVTLVKDTQEMLPLSVDKHKRILLYVLGDADVPGAHSGGTSRHPQFIELLRQAGFEITVFDPSEGLAFRSRPVRDIAAAYDAVIYFANIGTYSNQTVIRVNWAPPMGVDVPKFIHEIPTMFISVSGPYHLQDVPRIKTFINGYTPSPYVVEAVVAKLLGHSEFKGYNPVDPFCGLWDTQL